MNECYYDTHNIYSTYIEEADKQISQMCKCVISLSSRKENILTLLGIEQVSVYIYTDMI